MATRAKLSAASPDEREIGARLLNLLASVEKTLLYNQKQIRRLQRLCKALVVVGLLGWVAAGAVLVAWWSGEPLSVPRVALFSMKESAGLAGESAESAATDRNRRDDAAAPAPAGPASIAEAPPGETLAGDAPPGEAPPGEARQGETQAGEGERAAPDRGEPAEVVPVVPVAPVAPVVPGTSVAAAEVDDLVLKPELYLGRDVVVTGSVVRLFNRYRLRSEDGLSTIVIDVGALPAHERAALDGAFERASLLDHVRARIEGRVEREAAATFQLAARGLALLEPGSRPVGPGRDEDG
ncbi:MAG: hypothetical protein R3322_02285 [Kiloniellales bacterium]|nr:hypothetical protein [Kiloniellales bacterium]